MGVLTQWKSSLLMVTLFASFFAFEADAQVRNKKNILITSFEAFEGRPENNSARTAEELKRLFDSHPTLKSHYNIEFLVLPVRSRIAPKMVKEFIEDKRFQPDMVLSMGESERLAKESKGIQLNPIAHNILSYDAPRRAYNDLNGDKKIYRHWPDEIQMSLPIAQMSCALSKTDRKAISVADKVGTFVCNDIAYDLSVFFQEENDKKRIADSYLGRFKSDFDKSSKPLEAKKKDYVEKNSPGVAQKKLAKDNKYRELYAIPSMRTYLDKVHNPPKGTYVYNKKTKKRDYIAPPRVNFPREVLDYKKLISKYNLAKLEYDRKVSEYDNRLSSLRRQRNNDDTMVFDILMDSFRGPKPLHGFIHVSSISSKKESHDALSIAQRISVMIHGVFEERFPEARMKGRKVECGPDYSFKDQPGYQKLYKEHQALVRTRSSLISANKKYFEDAKVVATNERVLRQHLKDRKRSLNGSLLSLAENFAASDELLVEMRAFLMTAPEPRQAKLFFSGHEKYEAQGIYDPELPEDGLFRLATIGRGENKETSRDLMATLDSRGNIMRLNKMNPQVLFDHAGVDLLNLSAVSRMWLEIEEGEQLHAYRQREMKANVKKGSKGQKFEYTEMNRRIAYDLRLNYTTKKLETEKWKVCIKEPPPKNWPAGKKHYGACIRREERSRQVWRAKNLFIDLVLAFEGKDWKLFHNGNEVDLIEVAVGSINERKQLKQREVVSDTRNTGSRSRASSRLSSNKSNSNQARSFDSIGQKAEYETVWDWGIIDVNITYKGLFPYVPPKPPVTAKQAAVKIGEKK